MSKVAITGNTSGTGVFTVASPNSNVDRVLTLPDESGTVDTLQRSGNVVQVVNFQTGAFATGTTIIPHDDTIPQITEGNEYMTLAITPTDVNNILIIQVSIRGSMTGASYVMAALFQDATADALAASLQDINGANYPTSVEFTYTMTAGTISATTFKVRAGPDSAATFYLNGAAATRRFGGVSSSSITITEYAT
jgi:hypothetical protein